MQLNLFGYTIMCFDDNVSEIRFFVNDITFMIYYGSNYQHIPPTFNVPTFEKNW